MKKEGPKQVWNQLSKEKTCDTESENTSIQELQDKNIKNEHILKKQHNIQKHITQPRDSDGQTDFKKESNNDRSKEGTKETKREREGQKERHQ